MSELSTGLPVCGCGQSGGRSCRHSVYPCYSSSLSGEEGKAADAAGIIYERRVTERAKKHVDFNGGKLLSQFYSRFPGALAKWAHCRGTLLPPLPLTPGGKKGSVVSVSAKSSCYQI